MIKAVFFYDKNLISEFNISGHANAKKNENENDLVCAATSGIVFGILNSLNNEVTNKIEVKNNFIKIKVLDIENERNQIILQVLKKSLEILEKDYIKNIIIIIK